MSILFQSYELEFSESMQRINQALREFNQKRQKEREESLVEIERLKSLLKESIGLMEQEQRESKSRDEAGKVKKYKQKAEEVKRKVSKMQESYKKNKERMRLFDGSDRLEKETREQLI